MGESCRITPVIQNMKGSLNFVVGSTLSSTVAMIALCELVASERYKTGDKIFSLFPKKDSVYRSLPNRTISVILKAYLSDEERAKRRLSAILKDEVSKTEQIVGFSISEVMGVETVNGSFNFEDYGSARDVFLFSPMEFSFGTVYDNGGELAESLGLNIWVLCTDKMLPPQGEGIMSQNCRFFCSSYSGFIDDHYSVRVRVLNSELFEIHSNVMLSV